MDGYDIIIKLQKCLHEEAAVLVDYRQKRWYKSGYSYFIVCDMNPYMVKNDPPIYHHTHWL